jgi:hypothetical protein
MSPRRGSGPRCTVIWWHDIPSQVLVRDGDQTLKAALPERFQHAIDRAAMGGGQAGGDSYMQGWSRSERPCSTDLQAELDAEVAELEQRFPPVELERIITATRAARRSAARSETTPSTATRDAPDPESRTP